MASPTVHSLLRSHLTESEVYERTLAAEQDAVESKNIVALWMWLESLGARAVVSKMKSASAVLFERYVAEAKATLDRIRLRPLRNSFDLNSPKEGAPLPHTVAFIKANRDAAVRAMMCILDGVGRVIFNEELIKAARDKDAGLPLEPRLRTLLEKPYVEVMEPTEEDSRSMLVAYYWSPFSDAKAMETYFFKKWGAKVERVEAILGQCQWMAPCYGRIVFESPSFVPLLLEGNEDSLFDLGGWMMTARRGGLHFI